MSQCMPKAFDSVRHFAVTEKLALLDLPDRVYNWLVSFFSGHSHCTNYNGMKSAFEIITAELLALHCTQPAPSGCQNVLIRRDNLLKVLKSMINTEKLFFLIKLITMQLNIFSPAG